MYNLDSNGEYSNVPSHQSPTIIIHDAPLPIHMEEVHSSPIMENVSSKSYLVIHEEVHPSSYNIEEIFGAFTFNHSRKEGSHKRVRKVNQNDGTMEEIKEDEIQFEKPDEDPVIVATTSVALTQATTHNVTISNEKLLETK